MFQIDTVNRVRPCDLIRIAGRTLLVERMAEAPTPARPARIAVTVADPADSLAAAGWVEYLDAGETVHYRCGTVPMYRTALASHDARRSL